MKKMRRNVESAIFFLMRGVRAAARARDRRMIARRLCREMRSYGDWFWGWMRGGCLPGSEGFVWEQRRAAARAGSRGVLKGMGRRREAAVACTMTRWASPTLWVLL